MSDVARQARVGIGTVSRVINNSPGVREVTRKRVLAAINQLGYRQTRVARALSHRGGFAPTIGVLSPQFSVLSHQAIVVGAHRIAAVHGYHLLMFSPPPGADLETALARATRQFHVDGIMIVGYHPTGTVAIRQIVGPLMPVVAVGRPPTGVIPAVTADTKLAGTMAAEHLWSRGVRKPAIVSLRRYPQRSDAFMDFYRSHGVTDVDSRNLPTPEISEQDGYDMTLQLLSREPDGFFFCADILAVGGLRALRSAGLKLPVIGADNLNFSEWLGLTTIDLQFETMGRIGFEMLAGRIEGRPAESDAAVENHIIIPQLIVRAT